MKQRREIDALAVPDWRGLSEVWVQKLQADAWVAMAAWLILGADAGWPAMWLICRGNWWGAPLLVLAVLAGLRVRRAARHVLEATAELERRGW